MFLDRRLKANLSDAQIRSDFSKIKRTYRDTAPDAFNDQNKPKRTRRRHHVRVKKYVIYRYAQFTLFKVRLNKSIVYPRHTPRV